MSQYICEHCILEPLCDDCKDDKGKRYNVENCGDFNARLDTRQKIRIDGYWKDDKNTFSGQVCVINDMGIHRDEAEIFFYFSNWAEVIACVKESTAGEFIITAIAPY